MYEICVIKEHLRNTKINNLNITLSIICSNIEQIDERKFEIQKLEKKMLAKKENVISPRNMREGENEKREWNLRRGRVPLFYWQAHLAIPYDGRV